MPPLRLSPLSPGFNFGEPTQQDALIAMMMKVWDDDVHQQRERAADETIRWWSRLRRSWVKGISTVKELVKALNVLGGWNSEFLL